MNARKVGIQCGIKCVGLYFLELDKMQEIVTTFLDTKFVDLERRIRRVNRLDEREDYD